MWEEMSFPRMRMNWILMTPKTQVTLFFLDSTIPGSFFSSKGAHDGRPLNWNMLSLSKSNYWNGLTETKIGLFELLPAIKKMIEWYKKTNKYSRHKISQQAQALKSNF